MGLVGWLPCHEAAQLLCRGEECTLPVMAHSQLPLISLSKPTPLCSTVQPHDFFTMGERMSPMLPQLPVLPHNLEPEVRP